MATVWLLEDTDSDVRAFRSALNEVGEFHLEVFANSAAAVERLADIADSASTLPSLIVVDLLLSNSSGYDFLRFYHSNKSLKGIPLLVWSVNDAEHDKKMSGWMGALTLISKRSGPSTLRKSLAKALPISSGTASQSPR